MARALRDRLVPQVIEHLWRAPQFAHCQGKAMDEAISRVARHCRLVRERMREGTWTVFENAECLLKHVVVAFGSLWTCPKLLTCFLDQSWCLFSGMLALTKTSLP